MKRGGDRQALAGRALQKVLRGCLAIAAVALVSLSLTGHPRAGAAIAAGLLVGSVNGHLALRSLSSDSSFRVASLGRLGVLTAVGVGVGLLLGTDVVYLAIAGLAAAQLVLAGVAAFEVAR